MIRLFYLAAIFLFGATALAQGGPPLMTDDPGTPGDSHWEINAAGEWSSNQEVSILLLPIFDINYGWGDRIQLNLNTSFNWWTSMAWAAQAAAVSRRRP